jgi:hypothetical protein
MDHLHRQKCTYIHNTVVTTVTFQTSGNIHSLTLLALTSTWLFGTPSSNGPTKPTAS